MPTPPEDFSNTSKKWRKEFAEFFLKEHKRAQLTSEHWTPEKNQALKKIEATPLKYVPDLQYLLRLLMVYRRKERYIPPPASLRRLFSLWLLAKLEYVTEKKGFQGELAEDYEKERIGHDEESPVRELPNGATGFDQYWLRYGARIQDYLQTVLSPDRKPDAPEPDAPRIDVESDRHLPTLAEFPEAFRPLLVIVGDYVGAKNREPEHVAELFRQPQSYINIHYLLRLGLPSDTEIISDRLLLDLKDEEERAEMLGRRHILVIGNPTVNSVTRHLMLNKKLVFNFVFDEPTYRLGENFYDKTLNAEEGLFGDSKAVALFYRMMMESKGEVDLSNDFSVKGMSMGNRERIKDKVVQMRGLVGDDAADNDDVMEMFRPSQYFSPFESHLTHITADRKREYAVVSVGENIWSEILHKKDARNKRYSLLAVFGQNRVSTAIALKALSEKYKQDKDGFPRHPLGGVLEITLSNLKGPREVTDSTYEWLIAEYEAQKVLTRIERALKAFDMKRDAFTQMFETEEGLAAYKEMVERYVGGR